MNPNVYFHCPDCGFESLSHPIKKTAATARKVAERWTRRGECTHPVWRDSHITHRSA
jgi:hypothetical protein